MESLFSIMAYFKNKTRNRMSTKTLTMMAQLKLVLLEQMKKINSIAKTRLQNDYLTDVSEHEIMEVFDNYMLNEQVKLLYKKNK